MAILTNSTRAAALAAARESNNPFLLWENKAIGATLSGTTPKADGALVNAFSGTTYDYWIPNVTGTTAIFQVVFSVATPISCVAIAAHNFGGQAGILYCERSNDGGSTWVGGGAGAVTLSTIDNSPIVWRMDTAASATTHWRIRLASLTTAANIYAGVIVFGDDLVIPTRFYGGFAPAITPTEVQLQSNVSVGGNLLGSQVIGQGSTLAAPLRHLTPAFVRGASWKSFQRHYNAGKGFFFGWRPSTFASDAHYCWRDGDTLRPSNMGVLDYMQADLTMRAYEA